MSMRKAVVLARGLGRRMREPDDRAPLDEAQTAAADAGLKAMMPFDVPFLDYVLSGLADAGFADVCLVIGPDHAAIRRRYTVDHRPTRIQVTVAIQTQALGTANAVAAAESFAAGDPFIVINGDNYYPVEVLRTLRAVGCPAVAGFRRSALVSSGNFDAARLDQFALIRCNDRGDLADLIEKPDRTLLAAAGANALISMNCWSFDVRIFRACADVTPSARGELELPDAVRLGIARCDMTFTVIPFSLPVFDLSNRSDVQSMARHLATVRPAL